MRAVYEKIEPGEGHSFLCRRFCVPRFTTPWHYHRECELTLILNGSGTRYVGDSIEPFREGDLVLLGPDVPHFWQDDPPGATEPPRVSVVAQFSEDFLGGDFWQAPEFAGLRTLLRESRRGLHFAGETGREMGARLALVAELEGARRLVEFLAVLETLARSRAARPLSSLGFMPNLNLADAARINQVYNYISQHLGEPLYQPELASLVHMTPSSFSRYFRQKTGRTFSAAVNELRIGRAARLLVEQTMNVTEVCYACGFENLSNFNRRFREIKGASPREFVARFTGKRPNPPFPRADSVL